MVTRSVLLILGRKLIRCLGVSHPIWVTSTSNARNQAHYHKVDHQRSTACGKKGQGNADNRHDEKAHTQVKTNLSNKHTNESKANEAVAGIVADKTDVENSQQNQRQEENDDGRSNHSPLFAAGGENKVVGSFREARALWILGRDSLHIPLSKETAGANSGDGTELVHGDTLGIQLVVKQGKNTGFMGFIIWDDGPNHSNCRR